jgi:hypothetical protein
VRRPPTIAAVVALAVGLCGSISACSSGSGATGCGPIRHEALDPQFLVHVFGDVAVSYTSDPPTSGPHQPTPPFTGVQQHAITRPVQVGILERGEVLLQHRPDLPDAQRTALEALAGSGVVVAPDPDLHDPVVATAWVYKRTCSSVDTAALRDFIRQREGKGPGTAPPP